MKDDVKQNRKSGRLYAVELEDGVVTGTCGPLTTSEVEERFLTAFDYSVTRSRRRRSHQPRNLFELNGGTLGPPPSWLDRQKITTDGPSFGLVPVVRDVSDPREISNTSPTP